jgi:uncharacterized protein (DUF2249 family)/hemerythrin-like domain-containing protein
MPPRQRHPEIFRKFDALAPGQAFVLVNDHDPKPLLYQLQNERPRAFEWSVLEAGPERFRVEIFRRSEPSARNVTEFLGWDHQRLDVLFALAERRANSGDFFEATTQFAEFRCGLERHIAIEEQVLFPLFEERAGMASGPTTVMRLEHSEIARILDEIGEALADEDTSALMGAAGELREVLGGHNLKEERILYPMTDRALADPRDRDDLVRRMQAF